MLSFEFFYLTFNLMVGTWFGIGIFYSMLFQLLKVAFTGPVWLEQVRGRGACVQCFMARKILLREPGMHILRETLGLLGPCYCATTNG